MTHKLTLLVLITVFVFAAHAQTPTPDKDAERRQKLREEAVAFLQETAIEVNRMRSIENRISFSSELASLMWYHDEDQARNMYAAVIADFYQLMSRIESQYAYVTVDEDSYGPGLFGGPGRSPIQRKFQIAMGVRQQIAMALGEHSPEMALEFFYNSGSRIADPDLAQQLAFSDKLFEMQLLNRVAESNAAKAAELAGNSLKDGVKFSHVELLKKIYGKDRSKGVEFGAKILSRLKTDDGSNELWVLSSLFIYGELILEKSGKTEDLQPVYSRNDLRDIADIMARIVLDDEDDDVGRANGIADEIAEISPARAAQIRARFRAGRNSNANVAAVRAMTNTSAAYGAANANTAVSAQDQANAEADAQMIKDVMGLNASLPSEERAKIVARARDIISRTPGREKKVTSLSMLAAQVAKAGDKELAGELMRDAERFVDPQPRNYRDFLLTWMLASGYAEVDPEKAFPILENAIYRTNSLTDAFVRVAEFIDVNQELISDGEVQVGAFGGAMINGMIQGLGLAGNTVRTLAVADLAKTKALTNSFDRTETRVLAKMLVIRAVLKEEAASNELDDDQGNTEFGADRTR